MECNCIPLWFFNPVCFPYGSKDKKKVTIQISNAMVSISLHFDAIKKYALILKGTYRKKSGSDG